MQSQEAADDHVCKVLRKSVYPMSEIICVKHFVLDRSFFSPFGSKFLML